MTVSIRKSTHRGVVLLIVLTVTATSLLQVANITPVFAAYTNTYPWDSAPCATTGSNLGKTTGTGYWCTGYNWGEYPCPSGDGFCSSSNLMNGYYLYDQWGESFRNCVSYTAWQLKQVFNVDITSSNPSGWGSGKDWNTSALAAGYTDDSSPQAGDIAQWDATQQNQWGHVAYVYAVTNGVASYAEYNHLQDGTYQDSLTSSTQGAPTHYIHIADLSPFLIRTGTDIQGKYWLGNRWTTINTTTAADLRVTGNLNTSRISYTGTNGDVWAKDGPAGSMDNTGWSDEYPSPSQYATSPYLFVIRTGTTVSGKAGLNDPWTTLNGTAASDMRVSGDGSITYTATNGDVWAKEWLGGAWTDEYPSPDQYASSDTLFVIRLGTNVYGKVNLGDPWTLLNGTAATDIRVNGNRISYTATNGDVWAKDGLYGTWYDMYLSPSQYAASDNIFVVRNGTSVLAKAHLSDTSWTTLNGTSATDIRVNGNRVTYTDTNGDVWAKDYFGGAWTDEYNYPSQYAASNT